MAHFIYTEDVYKGLKHKVNMETFASTHLNLRSQIWSHPSEEFSTFLLFLWEIFRFALYSEGNNDCKCTKYPLYWRRVTLTHWTFIHLVPVFIQIFCWWLSFPIYKRGISLLGQYLTGLSFFLSIQFALILMHCYEHCVCLFNREESASEAGQRRGAGRDWAVPSAKGERV